MKLVIKGILGITLLVLSVTGVSAQGNANVQGILKQARAAIGGEDKINAVQSLSITGKSRHVAHLQQEQGQQQEQVVSEEFELDFLLPDKFMRSKTIQLPGSEQQTTVTETLDGDKEGTDFRSSGPDVLVLQGRHEVGFVSGGPPGEKRSEFARYLITLLLTAPSTFPVEWSSAGKADVNGNRADVLNVKGPHDFAARLYLDEQSHLPLMLSYQPKMFGMMVTVAAVAGEMKDAPPFPPQAGAAGIGIRQAPPFSMTTHTGTPQAGTQIATAQAGAAQVRESLPMTAHPEEIEIQIQLADYRSVDGVLLPHQFKQIINGEAQEEWEEVQYKINSPTSAEKFQKRK